MATPNHRWGVAVAELPTHDLDYLQTRYDNDNTSAKPGELFLNEDKREIYYVDQSTGEAKKAGSLLSSTVPTTPTSTGTAGEHAYDENYFYICVATNIWKRTPLSTWMV